MGSKCVLRRNSVIVVRIFVLGNRMKDKYPSIHNYCHSFNDRGGEEISRVCFFVFSARIVFLRLCVIWTSITSKCQLGWEALKGCRFD